MSKAISCAGLRDLRLTFLPAWLRNFVAACGLARSTAYGGLRRRLWGLSDSMTDITAIATANLGFSTTPRAKKLTPGDCDDDRRPEIVIWTFCSPISQFVAVGRCHNHLANPLSSWTSSKISNFAWVFRHSVMSQSQRCNCFRFWGPYRHFRLSISLVLTCQHYFIPVHGLIPQCLWSFNCTFRSLRDNCISGFGRHFRLSLIIGIAILDFWRTLTSHEIGSTTIRKLYPENMGVAVGIMSLCALTPPPCRQTSHKTVAERRVDAKIASDTNGI